jgi:hypothetical protein
MINFLTTVPKSLIVALGLGSMTLLSGCVADGNVYAQPAGYGYNNGWHHHHHHMMGVGGVGISLGLGTGMHSGMHRGMHRGMLHGHHCAVGVVC